MLNFLHKSILCTDNLGNQVKVQGIPKKVCVRQIYALQAKKCVRKGCKLFSVNIRDIESDREQCIEEFPILEEFKDLFPKEIFIRGNLGSKMGLIRKRAKISFCELEFKNQ